MEPDHERRAEELIPDLAPAAGGAEAGDCPPDDLLLGLVQQRLGEGVAEGIRAHLAACDDCRALAAVLADEPLIADDRPVAAARGHRAFPWPLLAAACLVVGAGIALLWRGTPEAPAPSLDVRLAAAAHDLVAAHPNALRGLRILDAQERRAVFGPSVERGALRVLVPQEHVFDGRPTFQWEQAPGASGYRVTVFDREAKEIWSRSTPENALPYPVDAEPLPRNASYRWTVTAEGALGRVEGRGGFTVLSSLAAGFFEDGRQAIAAATDPDLAPLLEAHLAIRRNLYTHAWHILEDPDLPHADDPVVEETRTWIAHRLGMPTGE